MQKNTNEKSKNENVNAKSNTAISPIVSVVKNEIHPPNSGASTKRAYTASLEEPKKPSKKSTIITDPNGSYTGTPLNPNEQPVQDVDDL